MTVLDLVSYVLLTGAFILLVYVVVRVASWAYFRTKLEHFRATLKEMRKGD